MNTKTMQQPPSGTAANPAAWVGQATSRQRASIRKTVPCTVQVRRGTSYTLATKIDDLSLTGVFVEMDTAGVVIGDTLEVRVAAADRQRQHAHELTLPAEVVRVEQGGVALRFGAYTNRTYTDLVNLLYAG